MPSSHHLLSSCTNARLGPPFLPEFATLIWQPTPMPPSHRQKNDVNLLHPCMLVNPLQCTTLCKIWIPSTVECILPKDSYQVHTSNGMVYCHMRWHLCECSVKPTDTTADVTSATLQAPARLHISVIPPAPAKPAQLPQPPPVAPAMPATPWLYHRYWLSPKSPLCLCLCLQHPA